MINWKFLFTEQSVKRRKSTEVLKIAGRFILKAATEIIFGRESCLINSENQNVKN